jgi:hypothetical protein
VFFAGSTGQGSIRSKLNPYFIRSTGLVPTCAKCLERWTTKRRAMARCRRDQKCWRERRARRSQHHHIGRPRSWQVGRCCPLSAIVSRDIANPATLAARSSTEYGNAYFMTRPHSETGDDRYRWLNRIMAVAEGRGSREFVEYRVYALANGELPRGRSCRPGRRRSPPQMVPTVVTSRRILVPLLVPYGSPRFASFCIDLHSNRPKWGRGRAKKRNKLRTCRSLKKMPQQLAAIQFQVPEVGLEPTRPNGHWILNTKTK